LHVPPHKHFLRLLSSRPVATSCHSATFDNCTSSNMDDQHDQPIDDTPSLSRSPSGVYHRSNSFPQSNAVSRDPTNYHSYGNVHGLPVPSYDRMPSNQRFEPDLPEDCLLYSDADLRSRLEEQSPELSTALHSSSMREFVEQAPLQPYDQSPELPSAPDPPTDCAHNSQRPFAHNHLTLWDSAHALDEEPNAHHQDPEIAEGSQISSRDPSAQPAIASTSRRLMISNPPANESDGLRFDSYANALSVTDRLFRRRLTGIPDDDDIDNVERDRHAHVSSIVDALKRNDIFLPPPEFKKRGTVALTPTQKDNWQRWQESAQQFVEINLSQPHAGKLVELRAWDIIEETIKIHRIGCRLTSQMMTRSRHAPSALPKRFRSSKTTRSSARSCWKMIVFLTSAVVLISTQALLS
jgi:hypothetical protein